MSKYVSDRTKECKHRLMLFTALHFLCMFGPLLYYIPYGYIYGETTQKIAMSFSVVAALVLAMCSIVVSVTARAGLHRCVLWLLIAGVLFTLTKIQIFIWIMCLTSILDELVFIRLKNHYKTALISNKEIDRRQ